GSPERPAPDVPVAMPDAAPYSDYLDWLGRRDARVDEDAWSERLDGLEHGTLVGKIAPPVAADTADSVDTVDTDKTSGTDGPGRGECLREVTGEMSDNSAVSPSALLDRAAEAGVTPNTMLQAAWSLSLASLTGDSDVLFGTTVSGRPTELPGIGNTVGLFINTVPARATVDPEQDLNGLLGTIGRTQARMSAHDATPLVRIEQLAGCGALFDSLVVHDNFPAAGSGDSGADADPDTISVGEIHTDGRTDFPVSVVSPPGDTFRIVLAYRPDLVDRQFIDLAHRTLVKGLASYAIPDIIEIVDEFPLTGVGKVSKKAQQT
ncbi:MAG: condensation domain-containing protein, partial [Candidatus Corynebacterium faecigallinarum]